MKFLTLITLTLALLSLQAHAAVLELREKITLTGSTLTLNDLVSSSQGVSADDLSSSIADSPTLGNSQTWTRDELAQHLPPALKADGIQWTGATTCEVDRPAATCTEHDVRSLVTAELAKHLPTDSDFSILEMPNVDAFPIPQGQLDTRVNLTAGSLRHEWADATIEFRYQGQLTVTKSVRFHWAYTRLVWQATNTVNSGEALSAANFQQVESNVLKLPGSLQPAADFPSAKIAAHALPEGKILMESDWVEPVLVKRDDIVTVLYAHHGVSITVEGKALSSGSRNDVIAVQNVNSHKIFNARVVDQRSLVYDE
jgi:flagella basal body P-ring formation protein FlgA